MSYNNNNGQKRDNGHLYTFMQATILGRLTRDPEKITNNGGTFYEFAVAINHQNGETTFVDISVNEKNAFLAGKMQYLTKGRNILVTGIMQIKAKGEGKVGSYVSLRPDHIQFVDTPASNGGAQQGGQPQQQQQQQQFAGQQQTPFSGAQPQQGFQPQQQQQHFAPQGGMPQQGFPQGGQQMPFNPQQQQQQFQQAPQGQQQGFGAPQQNPFVGAPGRG